MIDLLESKYGCCGCAACESICPKGAITMKPDEEGFDYPSVDGEKCIDCGKCKTVCPYRVLPKDKSSSPKTFAVKHRDDKVRSVSRSGGVFAAIAADVLKQGGFVFGAGFGKDNTVEHKCISKIEDLQDLQGVKYTQSNTSGVYPKVKEHLQNNKKVFFSGTPCQVAGLLNFLGSLSDSENLITADLVCHGVPSPRFYKDYINFYEKKYGGKIEKVSFRDKEYGWQAHFETFVINGKKYTDNKLRILFYKHLIIRSGCGNCQFARVPRVADLTLADAWGIKQYKPQFDDKKGVSLILLNSEKGIKAFDSVKDKLEVIPMPIEKCPHQNLRHPSKLSANREKMWNDYFKNGFEYVVKKYGVPDKKSKLKDFLIKHKLYK